MSQTSGKTWKVLLGVAIAGGVLYGGLGYWQLQKIDKIGSRLQPRQSGFFMVDGDIQPAGPWSREVRLKMGFARIVGGGDPFIEMIGSFTPGIRPSIVLKSQKLEAKETQIFHQANPELVLYFDYAMRPTTLDVKWNQATVNGETLGAGKVSTDFTFDPVSRKFTSFDMHGQTNESRTKVVNEEIIIDGIQFVYQYDEAPLRFYFSVRGEENKGLTAYAPVTTGPYSYSFKARQKKEGDVIQSQSDITFSVKDFVLKEESLPPLQVQYVGSLITSKDVWLPCLGSRVLAGELKITSMEFLPGVCSRKEASQMLDALIKQGIEGKNQTFDLQWSGGSVHVTGSFKARDTVQAFADIQVKLDATKKMSRQADQVFNKDIRNYLEGLVRQGAMEKVSDHEYKMIVQVNIDESYNVEVVSNGQNARNFDWRYTSKRTSTDPFDNSDIVKVRAWPWTDHYRGGGMKEFLVGFEKILSDIPDIQWRIEKTEQEDTYVIYIFVKEGVDAQQLAELLKVRIVQLLRVIPEGVSWRCEHNPVRIHPIERP